MPVPQATVQQRQDLSSFLAGNIEQSRANRDRNTRDVFSTGLDIAKTAYDIGSGIDQTIKQEDAQRAAGIDSEVTAIATDNGTKPYDAAKLRARMLLNPDLAQKIAQLHRYKTTGRLTRPTDDQAPLGDILGNLARTGQVETSYGKIKGDEALKTTDYLNEIAGGDYTKVPALVDLAKQFGDTVDSSERAVLDNVYKVYTGSDQESKNALTYAADLGGWAYLGGEPSDNAAPMQNGEMQQIPNASNDQMTTASQTPGMNATGRAPLQREAPGMLSNASSASGQAVGQMTASGQLGPKPFSQGMAPGMTTEITQGLQGTPAMQTAYAAVPKVLGSYLNVEPGKVNQAFSGMSEANLQQIASLPPDQQKKVLDAMAKQIQTALPNVFNGKSSEEVVKQAFAMRSAAAHSALSNARANGGIGPQGEVLKPDTYTLPLTREGNQILYAPNTGGGVQAPGSPSTPPENKTAQVGGMQPVSTVTTTRRPSEGGVALGVDENVLASAEMKAASGQPLTPEETLARNNLHKVANAHVRVNGDVLVRGVPMRELVKDFDKKLPEIQNGIRKLNGMGITVEDMMDIRNQTLGDYMSMLKPAQADFVTKNKSVQDLLNNIIQVKQAGQGDQRLDLEGKSLDLQRGQLAQQIKYQNESLRLEAIRAGAETAAGGTGTGAQAAKDTLAGFKLLDQQTDNLRQLKEQMIRSLGAKKAEEEFEKQKNDPKTTIGQNWKVAQSLYAKLMPGGELTGLLNAPVPVDPATAKINEINQGSPGVQASKQQPATSGTGASTAATQSVLNKFNIK